MSDFYKVGDVLDSKEYGKFEVLHIKSSVEVAIKFINSGNIKIVRAGDMLRGFVADVFKYKLRNKYKIGDVVKTKSSGDVFIVDMLTSTKILVEFIESGLQKFTTSSSLQQGRVRDESKFKYKKFRLGELVDTTNYGKIEILSIPSSTEATVRFVETGHVLKTRPSEIASGEIRDVTSKRFKPKLRSDYRFCVYLHKDSDGVVRYVGQGVQSRAFVFTGRNPAWRSMFSVANPPTVEVVQSCLSKESALDLELDLIGRYSETILNRITSTHKQKEMLFDDFASNFKYDETSPTFLMRKTKNGQYIVAGFNTGKYYKVSLKNSSYGVHRVIWLLHNGRIDSNMVVDHIDNNPSNNSIDNLRMVSFSENSKNRISKLPRSGFRNILQNYDVSGNVVSYHVFWRPAFHDRSIKKLFSVSDYSDSMVSALRAAYYFRETLIQSGELFEKIKQGEKVIE